MPGKRPFLPSDESNHYKRTKMLGKNGKDIFRTLYYECFVKESSELLVDDGSYPFPYLITHDEMNAFDVEWVRNEDYSRVGEETMYGV
ncbi:23222_t:CDS:2 [Rhizophagus irregularis]|nr:23222_t:CDS:2 [Rhizophagus irregularis]